MTQALRYFKESTGQQHLLAQVWAPVKNRGRYVLTTSGQPFVLGPNSNGLNQYRMVSLTYMFSLDGEPDGELGLPGRVFRKKLPEWTPNVQYYSSKEFSRLGHALHYNVQGTLALPVFEPSRQLCVGVVELIMTSPKINYAPEVEKVCKALEVWFYFSFFFFIFFWFLYQYPLIFPDTIVFCCVAGCESENFGNIEPRDHSGYLRVQCQNLEYSFRNFQELS